MSAKAVLIYRGVRFPYSHDLADLLSIVEQTGEIVPEPIKQAARLSRYAVAWYPGIIEAVTPDEHQEAVAIAERVVQWAEGIIRQSIVR